MAKALAGAGADVAVHYIKSREQALKTAAAVRALGSRAIAVRADVTSESRVGKMFDMIEKRLGPVDILVNNVGDLLLKSLSKMSPAAWRGVIDSNLNSAFLCCRRAVPGMRKRSYGRIINMGYGPCEGFESRGRSGAYHMTKTALLVYTKALAREEAGFGITVNMISPGTLFSSRNRPPVRTIPAGRYGRYGDITNALLFLLRAESSYITGTNLLVTGGKDV